MLIDKLHLIMTKKLYVPSTLNKIDLRLYVQCTSCDAICTHKSSLIVLYY